MSQESFIICDNLVKIYKVLDHDVVALQGLDMSVFPSEILGIVGVSGSGKSTLMNILGGLDRPNAGRIWVDGRDLLKLTDMGLNRYRLTSVGFLWQQSARNLIPYLNALENVEYPMTIAGEFGTKKRQRAIKLLETVGLADRRNHRLSELSGGEQQRVAIAVALANNPRLLLADEPTGEVDGKTAQVIYQILHNLRSEFGLTTLIVSHDPNLSNYVDRVISIRDGKISTEMIRQNGIPATPSDEATAASSQSTMQHVELTVVDSAGRLQIPKDLRERLNIKDRVRLEPMEGSVIIWPVQVEKKETVEDMVDRLEQGSRSQGLQQLTHWVCSFRGKIEHMFERHERNKIATYLLRLVHRMRGDQEHDN
jgi:putative ABC transport system ATP-binding protein